MRSARRLLSALALTLAFPLAACGEDDAGVTAPPPTGVVETERFAPALAVDLSASTRTSTGLYYRILTPAPATAATATSGRVVSVRYAGRFVDGRQFDANTIQFTLGAGRVIAGWDQGIAGMRVGERRQLVVPPALGYGASGSERIPPNTVLVFDVELLSVT